MCCGCSSSGDTGFTALATDLPGSATEYRPLGISLSSPGSAIALPSSPVADARAALGGLKPPTRPTLRELLSERYLPIGTTNLKPPGFVSGPRPPATVSGSGSTGPAAMTTSSSATSKAPGSQLLVLGAVASFLLL